MTEGAVAMSSRSNSRVQPLLDDLEVQEPEEAAAEAEAERGGGLHLVGEAGVVEAQPPIAARRSSNSAASTGNRPQNTTGCAGRSPAAPPPAPPSSVMVSPTRVSATSLICAVM